MDQNNALIEKLIATDIALQSKITDLLIGVKDLNTNVKSLVTLFKDAAEHIRVGKYEDPLVEKLNDLLEQNKNLAKGLIMLEKYVNEKTQSPFKHPASEF